MLGHNIFVKMIVCADNPYLPGRRITGDADGMGHKEAS